VSKCSALRPAVHVYRTDRICKYNQLLRIEDELDEVAIFRGKGVFYNIKK